MIFVIPFLIVKLCDGSVGLVDGVRIWRVPQRMKADGVDLAALYPRCSSMDQTCFRWRFSSHIISRE